VAKVRVQSSTGTMLERISSGENLIGYNVLGSYALVRAKTDPSLGVVLPKDYTLIMSRVHVHQQGGKNVNAAKLWLDYTAVAARPDRHRQRLQAVRDPRRRHRRNHLAPN
jgi:iron(III) transport system substrate-binding protein